MNKLFGGRLRRLWYLIYSAPYALLIFFVVSTFGSYFEPKPDAPDYPALSAVLFFGGIFLLNIFFSVMITVMRLHDLGLAGWWYLVLIAAVAALFALAVLFRSPGLHSVAWGSQFAIWLLLCSLPGTPGANRYGAGRVSDM